MELKIALFITSFLPLWISIIFVNIWSIIQYIFFKTKGNFNCNLFNLKNFMILFSSQWLEISFSIILLILFLISARYLYCFFYRNKKSINKPVGIIKKVSRAYNLGSDYLLAYILPMIAFNFSSLKDVILFCIIFIILGFLCIRNENIYTNIYLEFLGYQMFFVNINKNITEDNINLKEGILFLSKNDLRLEINQTIEYYEITNYIYINF
ncbi:hypothetical protein [Cetobacterium ceti]